MTSLLIIISTDTTIFYSLNLEKKGETVSFYCPVMHFFVAWTGWCVYSPWMLVSTSGFHPICGAAALSFLFSVVFFHGCIHCFSANTNAFLVIHQFALCANSEHFLPQWHSVFFFVFFFLQYTVYFISVNFSAMHVYGWGHAKSSTRIFWAGISKC